MQEILQRFLRVFISNHSSRFSFAGMLSDAYMSSFRESPEEFLSDITSGIPLKKSQEILLGISPGGFSKFPKIFLLGLHHTLVLGFNETRFQGFCQTFFREPFRNPLRNSIPIPLSAQFPAKIILRIPPQGFIRSTTEISQVF